MQDLVDYAPYSGRVTHARNIDSVDSGCTKYLQRMHELFYRLYYFSIRGWRKMHNAHVPTNPAFWRQDGCYNFRIYTRLHKMALKMFFVQFSVVTSNSPSRLDVGFITLKSDANVKSRQHEYNGSDQERLRICR